MTEEQVIEIENQQLKDAAKELELLYTIRAQECYDSFYQFFLEFWDVINEDELIDNWHIEYLCNYAQIVVERAIKKQNNPYDTIINIPPGTTKSTIFCQMLGAWIWVRAPYFVIITSTHTRSLSVDHSLKSKDIVKSDRYNLYFQNMIYRKHGMYLHLTKDNEMDWRNNHNGVRYFTSVTGGTIGRHAHIIVWDDLIDVERSTSELFKMRAIKHLRKVLSGRKKDKKVTPTIGIMQRLEQDDPTGYMIEKTKVKINLIKLPAEASGDVQPPKLRDYYKDGLLDPIRLSTDVLADQRTILGEYGYAGQFMQEPAPEGGGKIKRAWLKYTKADEVPRGIIWDLWVDGAYTKHAKNDPTGFMMSGFHKPTNMLYIRHAFSEWLEMPALLDMIVSYVQGNGYSNKSRTYIEPKASGHSLKQMLRTVCGISAMEIKGRLVSDGKPARESVASPRIEAGSVCLIEGLWNADFVDQLSMYPNASHDEYIDLIGYACDHYFNTAKAKGVKVRSKAAR